MKTQLCLLIFSLLIVKGHSQSPVIDESHLDPSFLQFKLKLTQAVLDRDAEQLRPLVHHTVNYSYDAPEEESGDNFILLMEQSAQTGDAMYWKELYTLISWGFLRKPKTYEAPEALNERYQFQAPSFHYTYGYWEKAVITGRNVNIRKGPGTNFPVIRQATWEAFDWHSEVEDEVVAENLYDGERYWVELVMPDGELGYVAPEYSSTRILCELSVVKFADGWKIVSFYHPPGC